MPNSFKRPRGPSTWHSTGNPLHAPSLLDQRRALISIGRCRSSRARAMDSLDIGLGSVLQAIDRVRAPLNPSPEGAGGSFTILQGLSNLAAQIMVKSGFRPRACLRSAWRARLG